MINTIHFQNYKVLRNTVLELQPLTLLIGPNGSGKSTVTEVLRMLRASIEGTGFKNWHQVVSAQVAKDRAQVQVLFDSDVPEVNWRGRASLLWEYGAGPQFAITPRGNPKPYLAQIAVYSLDPGEIADSGQLEPTQELSPTGARLAVFLDRLRDEAPEGFEALNAELPRWLPPYDRILFRTPSKGQRAFGLRLASSGETIQAPDLSQGTLLAVAMLAIAHQPAPPKLIALEEPDRGIHPRLLREVRDAMLRLAYPEPSTKRLPIQVITTTHSPILLDLFRERPEEVVLVERIKDEGRFTPLNNVPHVNEILDGSTLGEAWFTGLLGGLPEGQ